MDDAVGLRRLESGSRRDADRRVIGGEEAVAALVSIASDRPFLEDGWVRVPVAERRGTIADAVRRLDDAGIAIDDISVSTPTLDDVFLNLTGHAAEQEREEAEAR